MPDLPRELIDAIIHFLYDDKISLRNCSVVAKSWSYYSRVHLFREISLGELHSSPKKFTRLQECLANSSFLTRHIQCVNLCNFWADTLSWNVAETIASILDSLLNVRELRIRRATFKDMMSLENIRAAVLMLMRRDALVHLFVQSTFISISDFRQLLNMPPNLVTLTLYDSRINTHTPSVLDQIADPPRRDIKKLHIRGQIDHHLVEWLTGLKSFLNPGELRHLCLSPLCYSTLVRPLLLGFTSVLRHLEIFVYESTSLDVFISQMPHLLSIKLFGTLYSMNLMFQDLKQDHPLEDVEIVQHCDAFTSNGGASDLSDLDSSLTHRALRCLHRVQITVLPLKGYKYDARLIVDRCLRLQERGILFVSEGPGE